MIGKLTYVGCMADGAFHGKGVLKFDNGHTRAGNFVNGQLDGEGRATYGQEGFNYVGGFRNGLYHVSSFAGHIQKPMRSRSIAIKPTHILITLIFRFKHRAAVGTRPLNTCTRASSATVSNTGGAECSKQVA